MADLAKCTFILNNQPFSWLTCDGRRYLAFSGMLTGLNNAAQANVPNVGPIPPGLYYIVDRPLGGRFPWLELKISDLVSGSEHEHWFALYAKETMSDFVFVQGIRRSLFRLHPAGWLNHSEGCITVENPKDFDALRGYLLREPARYIGGTKIRYYGIVKVSDK